MVAIASLRLLSGSDATSAPDIAPHSTKYNYMPPRLNQKYWDSILRCKKYFSASSRSCISYCCSNIINCYIHNRIS